MECELLKWSDRFRPKSAVELSIIAGQGWTIADSNQGLDPTESGQRQLLVNFSNRTCCTCKKFSATLSDVNKAIVEMTFRFPRSDTRHVL